MTTDEIFWLAVSTKYSLLLLLTWLMANLFVLHNWTFLVNQNKKFENAALDSQNKKLTTFVHIGPQWDLKMSIKYW